MKPVPGSEGGTINWLNYKTGVRDLYFRLDADKRKASVAIELHGREDQRLARLEQLRAMQRILEAETGESWEWQAGHPDESGLMISRIVVFREPLNIFNPDTWPGIISFFKPRIMALDAFWANVKDHFVV